MVSLRLSFRLIGLISTLILVRLLVPKDFGLIGLVTAAYSVLDGLSAMSLQLAIIRMSSPGREDYDTAWTLGFIRAFIIATLLILASPLLAVYVHEPRMIELSWVLAAVTVLQSLENIRIVDFQREFRYDLIFRYQIVGKLAGFFVVVPLAYLLRNYWALLCGITAVRLSPIPLGYVMRPYRPRFSLSKWQEMFHFSKWLMLNNVLWVVDSNVMTFVIGRFSGASAIGMYQVANQIGGLPASEIAAPMRDPQYAGFSRLADDIVQFRRYLLDNFATLAAAIVPLSLAICVLAQPIATIFLGSKWLSTIPLIRLCALYALFDAIGHYPGGAYIARGKQHVLVFVLASSLLVRVPAVLAGALMGGMIGAATALVLSAVLNMVLWNAFLPREVSPRFVDYIRATWRTCAAGVAMAAILAMIQAHWSEPASLTPALAQFAAMCIAGATVQVTAQLFLWHVSGRPNGAEADAIRIVMTAMKRLKAWPAGALDRPNVA